MVLMMLLFGVVAGLDACFDVVVGDVDFDYAVDVVDGDAVGANTVYVDGGADVGFDVDAGFDYVVNVEGAAWYYDYDDDVDGGVYVDVEV